MAESKGNQPTGDSTPIKKSVPRDAAAKAAKPQPAVASERELADEELDKAAGGRLEFLNPQPLPPG